MGGGYEATAWGSHFKQRGGGGQKGLDFTEGRAAKATYFSCVDALVLLFGSFGQTNVWLGRHRDYWPQILVEVVEGVVPSCLLHGTAPKLVTLTGLRSGHTDFYTWTIPERFSRLLLMFYPSGTTLNP